MTTIDVQGPTKRTRDRGGGSVVHRRAGAGDGVPRPERRRQSTTTKIPVPLTEVGALLDANAVHGGRRAQDQLVALAVSNGLPRRQVGEVLVQTGLERVARKRVGGFAAYRGTALSESLLAVLAAAFVVLQRRDV